MELPCGVQKLALQKRWAYSITEVLKLACAHIEGFQLPAWVSFSYFINCSRSLASVPMTLLGVLLLLVFTECCAWGYEEPSLPSPVAAEDVLSPAGPNVGHHQCSSEWQEPWTLAHPGAGLSGSVFSTFTWRPCCGKKGDTPRLYKWEQPANTEDFRKLVPGCRQPWSVLPSFEVEIYSAFSCWWTTQIPWPAIPEPTPLPRKSVTW